MHAGEIQAVFLQATDLVVLHQHVATGEQFADQYLPFGSGEIDGDRAFAAIGAQVVRRLARVVAVRILQIRRAPGAGVVADAGTLDLDHVGAEIGQHLRGPRAGKDARQIKHTNAFQQFHFGHHAAHASGSEGCHATACWKASARAINCSSSPILPTNCMPTGNSPAAIGSGTDNAGLPARLA
ncbi:hypothetical protein D3C71_1428260 [compost metagenome]